VIQNALRLYGAVDVFADRYAGRLLGLFEQPLGFNINGVGNGNPFTPEHGRKLWFICHDSALSVGGA
jgi:hypothetical protein